MQKKNTETYRKAMKRELSIIAALDRYRLKDSDITLEIAKNLGCHRTQVSRLIGVGSTTRNNVTLRQIIIIAQTIGFDVELTKYDDEFYNDAQINAEVSLGDPVEFIKILKDRLLHTEKMADFAVDENKGLRDIIRDQREDILSLKNEVAMLKKWLAQHSSGGGCATIPC